MHTADPFSKLWALGYRRLTPIIPPGAPVSERSSLFKRLQKGDDARGKMPGVRWPDGTWSGFDFVQHESTEADLAKWHAMGAGAGIKTGDGLALIDADTLNAEHAGIIAEAVRMHFGALPVRYGNRPKAGYLVRVRGPFRYARVEFGTRDAKGRLRDRAEILYEGRQFVALGVHPGTLRPYEWPDGIPPRDDVPEFDAAVLMAFLETLRERLPNARAPVIEGGGDAPPQDGLRGPWEAVRRAVEATPNTSEHFPTRESYLAYGYALKAAAGPEHERDAEALWLDWCARWADGENDPDVAAADWRRMKGPFRAGAPRLYELAQEASDGTFKADEAMASQWFEDVGEPLFPDMWATDKGATDSKPLKLVPFVEAAEGALASAAKPLIKGLLDQGAMTVLYGESNTGKTFVAMDMAYHVSRGLPWGGMRVERMGVLYVAAEGGVGARKRAAALLRRHGPAGDDFRYLLAPVDLLRADGDLRPLAEAACGAGGVGLIVIDTLSRAMAGGDENSSVDMGAMVKSLDTLRKATGAHVMVVHHSGKDRARGARGHSLLRAATDTEIEVADGAISVTKQRDLDKAWSSAFALDVVQLGADADGDPITSCIVRLAARSEVVFGVATAAELTVIEAVRAMDGMGADGTAGAALADVSEWLSRRADKMSKETARFHIKSLLAKNLVRRVARGRYSAPEKAEEKASSASENEWFDKVQPEDSGGKAEEDIFA